jgi:hypothetical protein
MQCHRERCTASTRDHRGLLQRLLLLTLGHCCDRCYCHRCSVGFTVGTIETAPADGRCLIVTAVLRQRRPARQTGLGNQLEQSGHNSVWVRGVTVRITADA